jgi:hypothetical protein
MSALEKEHRLFNESRECSENAFQKFDLGRIERTHVHA